MLSFSQLQASKKIALVHSQSYTQTHMHGMYLTLLVEHDMAILFEQGTVSSAQRMDTRSLYLSGTATSMVVKLK